MKVNSASDAGSDTVPLLGYTVPSTRRLSLFTLSPMMVIKGHKGKLTTKLKRRPDELNLLFPTYIHIVSERLLPEPERYRVEMLEDIQACGVCGEVNALSELSGIHLEVEVPEGVVDDQGVRHGLRVHERVVVCQDCFDKRSEWQPQFHKNMLAAYRQLRAEGTA